MINIQRYLSDRNHDQDNGNLTQPGDADHHYGHWHQASQNWCRFDLPQKLEHLWFHPSKIQGKMCIKSTRTKSKIVLWFRPTINFIRRKNQTPPSRHLRQATTLLYTLLYSRSYGSRINMNNIPSSLYYCQPGNYTTPSIMQTRIQSITCSDSLIHISSNRHAM